MRRPFCRRLYRVVGGREEGRHLPGQALGYVGANGVTALVYDSYDSCTSTGFDENRPISLSLDSDRTAS